MEQTAMESAESPKQTEQNQDSNDPMVQYIVNKFKRLDRERKDWKKCAKSMFVCMSKQKGKPKQKKLLEKYLKLKHKYRKSW